MAVHPFRALTASVLLGTAGCSGPKSTNDIAHDPIFGAPRASVDEPLPGCPPTSLTIAAPILPMPWDTPQATFVVPGETVEQFGIDYEVSPLARVDSVRIEYFVDSTRASPPPITWVNPCPSAIPGDTLRGSSPTNDVVRARVRAEDTTSHGRRADVLFSTGSAKLTIDLGGASLSSQDSADRWFVIVEPGGGERRLIVAPAVSSTSSVEVTGIPTGPARIAVVQTPSVVAQDGTALLHAPLAFADDFRAFSKGHWEALVDVEDGVRVQLSMITPADTVPRFAQLGTNPSWSASDPPIVLAAAPTEVDGSLTVPCGVPVVAMSTSYSRLDLSLAGGTRVHLEPGDRKSLQVGCTAGSTTNSWAVTGTSLNGRDVELVVRGGAP